MIRTSTDNICAGRGFTWIDGTARKFIYPVQHKVIHGKTHTIRIHRFKSSPQVQFVTLRARMLSLAVRQNHFLPSDNLNDPEIKSGLVTLRAKG